MNNKMKSKSNKLFVLVFIALFVLIATSSTASAAEYFSTVYAKFSGTAGETLAVGDVVCVKGADGKVYKADADASALRPAVGVVLIGGSSGDTVQVCIRGVLAGQTAASPGSRIFLSATPSGTITTTGPTNAQTIGWVMSDGDASSTNYYINPVMPTSGGAGY